MKSAFQTRIALFNTFTASLSTGIAFIVLYSVVHWSVFHHMDSILLHEQREISNHLVSDGQHIRQLPGNEWLEEEHREKTGFSIFLQIVDQNNNLIFHSLNLRSARLSSKDTDAKQIFFNSFLNGEPIRQGQFALLDEHGEILGYLQVGMPRKAYDVVLNNLENALVLLFPLLSLWFFLSSFFSAGHGIAPIHHLIQAAKQLDEQHLEARLPLPSHNDEIYQLAITINDLLKRLDDSFQREKEITANLSHELRTPLTGIRGTLEVLIRKPRQPAVYEKKIKEIILETDRINHLIEQLLQISRIESGALAVEKIAINLKQFLQAHLEKWQGEIEKKQITTCLHIPETPITVWCDPFLLDVIVSNLISNALKYSSSGSVLELSWNETRQILYVTDQGIGIEPDKIQYVFNRFYRVDTSQNAGVPGTGLGLFMANKATTLQDLELSVESYPGKGTTFSLHFNRSN